LEQLVSQLNTADSIADRAQALRSIFLVLPDVPVEEPRWLQALERVAVVPTVGDIALLMAIVHEAIPGRLLRAAGGGPAIPIAIRPNIPGALPVEAAHLRREFRSIGEQFNADIASANGRLREEVLHLPPPDFQLDLFQLTQEQLHRDAVLGYWYRLIAEAAVEPNDRAFLAKIVADNLYTGAVTAARKSLRIIDAHLHGPTLPAE
jgi:hypothetical protein